jgi:hypothetical protein
MGLTTGGTMTDTLPIEIDVHLMNLGFFAADNMPDFRPYRFKHPTKNLICVSTTPERLRDRVDHGHAPVHIAEPREVHVAWKPSFEGEQPPF